MGIPVPPKYWKRTRVDEKLVQEKENVLIATLYNKFPDVNYTLIVTKWNDGSFMVNINHGENIRDNICPVHQWTWYADKITYKYEEFPYPYL